jgi:tetratricopeptide (TPR) repeat protein
LFAQVYGKSHNVTLGSDYSLAEIATKRGDLDRAERLYKQYQNAVEHPPTGKHPQSYIWAFYRLGEIERLRGKRSEAEASYQRALDLGSKEWGEDSLYYKRLHETIERVPGR